MEAIIFKTFETLFRLVGILIVTGALVSALGDLQEKALRRQHKGLVSMLNINQQLVGKTK